MNTSSHFSTDFFGKRKKLILQHTVKAIWRKESNIVDNNVLFGNAIVETKEGCLCAPDQTRKPPRCLPPMAAKVLKSFSSGVLVVAVIVSHRTLL